MSPDLRVDYPVQQQLQEIADSEQRILLDEFAKLRGVPFVE